MDVDRALQRLGGVARRPELLRLGVTDRQLTAAVRSGVALRARCGWYALPATHPELVEALRVGGRRACETALAALGVWLLRDGAVHVHVPQNAARLRSRADRRVRLADDQSGVVIHRESGASGSKSDVDVVTALRQLARHDDVEAFLVAVESARALKLLTRAQVDQLKEALPAFWCSVVERSRSDAGSGLESIVRYRLELLGIDARTQCRLADGIRVDLLIGDRLVIEVDGYRYHSSASSFTSDRERDLVLSALGYHVLRLTYAQVMEDWPSVEAAILLMVRRGDHLAR